MTDQQIRDRIAAHTAGAMLGMSVVVCGMAWPLLVASKPWWTR
jgi:hypothetical protein